MVLAGSESTVLLEGLSSQTLYHVSIFPVYENDVGLALRGTVTTCKTGITIRYCILKDLFVHQSHLSLDVSQSILKLNSGHLDDMLCLKEQSVAVPFYYCQLII